MTLLLDTHAFLWWRLDSRRLKRGARESIAAADIVFVSAASVWEIMIKQALGRITVADPTLEAHDGRGARCVVPAGRAG